MQTSRAVRAAVVAVVFALAMSLAACGGQAPDRAGGQAGQHVRVLTFADGSGGATLEALTQWADQVRVLSAGSVRIAFKDVWRLGEDGFETAILGDVRDRKVDMAWVGARVFDRVGVNSFQALLAPMLVDSYALQDKVFASGIPAQMMSGVAGAGVVGIGILPGPLRKVLGVSKPFLRPADFAGTVVGIQDSDLSARTFTALGATARSEPVNTSLDGLDGYEQQLSSISGNHFSARAKYVTGNLNLWPRPFVLLIGKAVFASLSPAQQAALRTAGAVSQAGASRLARSQDAAAATGLCADGMSLVTAPPGDLDLLRAAVQPVYTRLGADPKTSAWVREIEGMKADLAAAPDSQTCEGNSETSQTPIPEGTYEMVVGRDEGLKGCMGEVAGHDREINQLVLRHGTAQIYNRFDSRTGPPELGWSGPYRVFRDRVEFSQPGQPGVLNVAWAFSGGRLTLTDMRGGECGDVTVWTLHPWVLQR